VAERFTKFLENRGITHTLSSAYNPTGNIIVERINQTIGNTIRCAKGKSLTKAITLCERNQNLTFHSSLGTSPFSVLTGTHPLNNSTPSIYSAIDGAARQAKRAAKDRDSRNRTRITYTFKPGDQVCIKNPFPDKLDARWPGPYKVTSVSEKGYLLVEKNKRIQRVNQKRIKPFKGEVHVAI
jgi:hypothetical protein